MRDGGDQLAHDTVTPGTLTNEELARRLRRMERWLAADEYNAVDYEKAIKADVEGGR